MPARFCHQRRSRQSLYKGTVTVSGRVNDLVGNVRRSDWNACLLSGKDCLAVLSTPASSKRWIGGFNRLLYLLVRDQVDLQSLSVFRRALPLGLQVGRVAGHPWLRKLVLSPLNCGARVETVAGESPGLAFFPNQRVR